MKALLLHHPYVYPRFEQDFVRRIADLPEFDVARADIGALSLGVIAGLLGVAIVASVVRSRSATHLEVGP